MPRGADRSTCARAIALAVSLGAVIVAASGSTAAMQQPGVARAVPTLRRGRSSNRSRVASRTSGRSSSGRRSISKSASSRAVAPADADEWPSVRRVIGTRRRDGLRRQRSRPSRRASTSGPRRSCPSWAVAPGRYRLRVVARHQPRRRCAYRCASASAAQPSSRTGGALAPTASGGEGWHCSCRRVARRLDARSVEKFEQALTVSGRDRRSRGRSDDAR